MNIQNNLKIKNLIYFHGKIFLLSLFLLIALWYSLFIAKFSFIFTIDYTINNTISTLHSSEIINNYFIFVTHLFDPKIFLSWFFILLFLLIWNKKKYEALFLFFGVAGGQTIKIIMKWMTDRPRPENPFALYIHESSFPSGHAMTAIFLAIALSYLFTKKFSERMKYIVRINITTIALSVAFSRIFLQVHYFSDVFTGAILAIGSFAFTVLIFTFLQQKYQHTSLYKKLFF